MGNGHPAFFGWVNPPPALAGVIASLAAAAMNPSVVSGDHADVHLERAVVRWLAELVGFPHAPGGGLLTSGGAPPAHVSFSGARRPAPPAGRADRASGALPALVVGSAGTVNTGAIDPLDALADVATAEDLWFHVDGAYGAFGVLDPAIAALYRGMERADSLTLDPHKWLGVPVDAGCALVRDAAELRETFS